MSMLTVENIKKEYMNKKVLDGVSLSVQKGERVALVGSNGSGKTTLLKIIMGLEEPDGGRVMIPGWVKTGYMSQSFEHFYDNESRVRTAAYVSQIEKMESRMREIEAAMGEAADDEAGLDTLMEEYAKINDRFAAMDGYAFGTLLKTALAALGIDRGRLSVPLAKLSGGEKLRVMLAGTVISKPDLLVLDEPTNHLDIKALEWLEDYLVNFKGAVLLVSHDRVFLDRTATRIAELENGTFRVMKCGYTEYLAQKEIRKEYSFKRQKDLEYKIRREKEVVTTLRHQRKISAFNSRLKKIDRLEAELADVKRERQDLHLGRTPSASPTLSKDVHVSSEVAVVKGLSKRFGEKLLFENADFTIYGGDKVGIIGDNGTGKTTLLNILCKNDTDYSGKAWIGEWIRSGFIGQDVSFDDGGSTVLEKIMAEAGKAGIADMSEKEALAYCARYKFFGDETLKKIEVLSGGEKSRLALAVIMLSKPNCLIMDEPTNHMDIYARRTMNALFSEFKGTVIAVSHDRQYLNECTDRILCVGNGRIDVFEGGYEKYVESRNRQKTLNADTGKGTLAVRTKKSEQDNREKGAGDVLEESIFELDEWISAFEASVGPDTDHAQFEEYGRKKKQLQKLYGEWEAQLEAGYGRRNNSGFDGKME